MPRSINQKLVRATRKLRLIEKIQDRRHNTSSPHQWT
jgi:hypothetical protein